MSIRSIKTKDHLREFAGALHAVQDSNNAYSDPLRFLTMHPQKPVLVDLTHLSTGQSQPLGTGPWKGPYKGRPELTLQLAAALKDRLTPLAEKSVTAYLNALRSWWRVLDAADMSADAPCASVEQLTDIHKQLALDSGMRRTPFTLFLTIVNTVRVAVGQKPLYWVPPTDAAPVRELPPPWQADLIRHSLKRAWYQVVDRWRNTEVVRSCTPMLSSEQELLRKNYELYRRTQIRERNVRPDHLALMNGFKTLNSFYDAGYSAAVMMKGFYPDGDDIRTAFHLCLIYSGWNPAVLLNLDVHNGYIEEHPKDANRYILRSIKEKAGGVEITCDGLFKTEAGPGFIVQLLVKKTAPLRRQLKRELRRIEHQLHTAVDAYERATLTLMASQLKRGIKSVWLYASATNTDIQWLHDDNFALSGNKHFLRRIIDRLNSKQPKQKQLSYITSGDFRDYFGSYAYMASGGSILAVKRVLHHKSIKSSIIYVNNKFIRRENERVFLLFINGLWEEVETRGEIDPTVLARLAVDSHMSQEERNRLSTYRSLMTTRMGTKCLDPENPPSHIEPTFKKGGGKLCGVQRCLLCPTHAIILEESLDGLVRRHDELQQIRESMNFASFLASSFQIELENIETVILLFQQNLAPSQQKISGRTLVAIS